MQYRTTVSVPIATGTGFYRRVPARTGVHEGPGLVEPPELLWKFKTDDEVAHPPASATGPSISAVEAATGPTSARDLTSGEEKWVLATGAWDIQSSPAIVEDVAFSGTLDGDLHAVDITTGDECWTFEAEGWLCTPAISDGIVYITGNHGDLYAVDAQAGETPWSFEPRDPGAWSAPTICDGVVYAPVKKATSTR